MPPQGLTILDLPKILDKYFELSQDLFARAHYQAMLDARGTQWDIAPVSWDWLRSRLEEDAFGAIQDIANYSDDLEWWEGL